jgi:hypothetical protein
MAKLFEIRDAHIKGRTLCVVAEDGEFAIYDHRRELYRGHRLEVSKRLESHGNLEWAKGRAETLAGHF